MSVRIGKKKQKHLIITDIAARITIHCLSRCGIHLTRLLYAYQLKKDETRKGEKTAKTKPNPNPNPYKWTDDKRQRTKRGGFEGEEEEEEEREATCPSQNNRLMPLVNSPLGQMPQAMCEFRSAQVQDWTEQGR